MRCFWCSVHLHRLLFSILGLVVFSLCRQLFKVITFTHKRNLLIAFKFLFLNIYPSIQSIWKSLHICISASSDSRSLKVSESSSVTGTVSVRCYHWLVGVSINAARSMIGRNTFFSKTLVFLSYSLFLNFPIFLHIFLTLLLVAWIIRVTQEFKAHYTKKKKRLISRLINQNQAIQRTIDND